MKKENIIIKIVIAIVFVTLLTLSIVLYNGIYGVGSIFSPQPDRSAAIDAVLSIVPAVMTSLIYITGAYTILWIVNLVINAVFEKVSNKIKTVLTLLRSLLKWVAIIIVVIFTLQAFGVDMATLLAGLGILALIIGLGAQQIIADVLAGFFIVFEAEFSVGDIVTIDGWRGTVTDIGVRVTKLKDASGNIKIVNNSDIRSIVNLTTEHTVAYVNVGIDYGEDLNKVELIIRDNLDKIKANIPAIIDGPYYKGVSELGASSVDLMFVATCKETDFYQVKRDINREIFLLFNEYGITIPFAQVTVSQREEGEKDYKKKFERNKKDERAAKEFVEEQADLSKKYDPKRE